VTTAISTLTKRVGATITRRTASGKGEKERKEEETRVWAQEEKMEEK